MKRVEVVSQNKYCNSDTPGRHTNTHKRCMYSVAKASESEEKYVAWFDGNSWFQMLCVACKGKKLCAMLHCD